MGTSGLSPGYLLALEPPLGIPIQPECVPSEHDASSIPGTSNLEEAFNCPCGQAPDIASSTSSDDAAGFTPWTEPDEEAMHQEEGDVNYEPEVDKLRKHAAAFVLTSREKHCLSQRAVSDIISRVQQYQASLLDCLRNQITDAIQRRSGVTDQLMIEVLDVFNNFKDPFDTVSTTYMQDATLKKQFMVVEAEEIEISQTASLRKKGASQALTIRTKCFYYISLVRSLEQLLSHPMVLAMFDSGPRQSKAGFFYDIIDGDIFKSHPLFSVRPNALQLILYTDEIELCHPLGSHASKNKFLIVYYTLGNTNPKQRSKLAAIRLLAIAKTSDISQCGVDVILQRIHEDLNLLYNDVNIKTAKGERTVYGAVVSLCGDTLAHRL